MNLKVICTALIISVIVLSTLGISCKPEAEAPVNYTSHKLSDVAFSYPADWTDMAEDLEEAMEEEVPDWKQYVVAAMWGDPSDSAVLEALALDLDALEMPAELTNDDKVAFASLFSSGGLTEVDKPTIQDQGETHVAGEWAWEMYFTGKMEGVAVRGYTLIIFHERTAFALLYTCKEKAWDELGEVYSDVKESISFD